MGTLTKCEHSFFLSFPLNSSLAIGWKSFKLFLCIDNTLKDIVFEFKLNTDEINLVTVDVRVGVTGASDVGFLALAIGRWILNVNL